MAGRRVVYVVVATLMSVLAMATPATGTFVHYPDTTSAQSGSRRISDTAAAKMAIKKAARVVKKEQRQQQTSTRDPEVRTTPSSEDADVSDLDTTIEPISRHGTAIIDMDIDADVTPPTIVSDAPVWVVRSSVANLPVWMEGDGAVCPAMPSLVRVITSEPKLEPEPEPIWMVGDGSTSPAPVEEQSTTPKAPENDTKPSVTSEVRDQRRAIKMRIRRIRKQMRINATSTAAVANRTASPVKEAPVVVVTTQPAEKVTTSSASSAPTIRITVVFVILAGVITFGAAIKAHHKQESTLPRQASVVEYGSFRKSLETCVSSSFTTPSSARPRPKRRCSSDCGLPI
mmetsp:Transcript_54926/g.76113  ORF Transcript_54926/g.76113 Transcript_54926/m.76113 type:complete len:343 (-) Transcript_54926:106-1134(-)